MTNIILHGACGRMGQTIASVVAENPGLNIVAGVDSVGVIPGGFAFPVYRSLGECKEDADVIIDFSHHTAVPGVVAYGLERGIPVLIATTGLSPEEYSTITEASKTLPVFHSSNFSLGINCLAKAMAGIVPSLEGDFHIEIVEKHHALKKDSPSGTALLLADSINKACKDKKEYIYGRHSKNDLCGKEQMGIHAVRGGTIPGEHSIIFAGPDEVIEITHTAYSRAIFARGAVKAAEYLAGKPVGLYSMQDLI